jgi:hypothetical protein
MAETVLGVRRLLMVFAVAPCAASVASQADEIDFITAQMPPNVVNAYRNCLTSQVRANAKQIDKLIGLNANVPLMLALSCDGFITSYIWHCNKLGKSEGECATFAREEAERMLDQIRN